MAYEKILLADDEEIALESLALGLEAAGYRVLTASGGEEAVKLAGSEYPDLAVLDIRMPDMSGIEAAKIIDGDLGIPVLFLSSYSDTDTVEAAADTTAMGYVTKPVSAARLLPSIETALQRAKDMGRLVGALGSARTINQAVGIVMERYRLSSSDAFEAIRSKARARRKKIFVLAKEIIDAAEVLGAVGADPRR